MTRAVSALIPVVEKKMPLVIQASSASDIKRVKLGDVERGLVATPNGRLITAAMPEVSVAGD